MNTTSLYVHFLSNIGHKTCFCSSLGIYLLYVHFSLNNGHIIKDEEIR
jgi:hypothetical protein